MKDVAPAIERLGVPDYNWWNEALHGVARSGLATVFPQAIGFAATWNDSLIFRMATAISDEARAKHHEYARNGSLGRYQGLTFWSPNINIFRDPRWGRGQETYGEDPFLTGRLGVQFVRGLQGDDPTYLQDRRDGEALRRPQRARARAPHVRRCRQRARPARDVPAALRDAAFARRRPTRSCARTTAWTARPPAAATCCSRTFCATNGSSRASSSPTAGRSTTSTSATRSCRRRRPRPRSP